MLKNRKINSKGLRTHKTQRDVGHKIRPCLWKWKSQELFKTLSTLWFGAKVPFIIKFNVCHKYFHKLSDKWGAPQVWVQIFFLMLLMIWLTLCTFWHSDSKQAKKTNKQKHFIPLTFRFNQTWDVVKKPKCISFPNHSSSLVNIFTVSRMYPVIDCILENQKIPSSWGWKAMFEPDVFNILRNLLKIQFWFKLWRWSWSFFFGKKDMNILFFHFYASTRIENKPELLQHAERGTEWTVDASPVDGFWVPPSAFSSGGIWPHHITHKLNRLTRLDLRLGASFPTK